MKSGNDSSARLWFACDRLQHPIEVARSLVGGQKTRREEGEENWMANKRIKRAQLNRTLRLHKQTKTMMKNDNKIKRSHIFTSLKANKRIALLSLVILVATFSLTFANGAEESQSQQAKQSTQPTIERQVSATSGPSSVSASQGSGAPSTTSSSSALKAPKPVKQTASQLKKAVALAAQQSYDRHQLKASPSYASSAASQPAPSATEMAKSAEGKKEPISGQQAHGNSDETTPEKSTLQRDKSPKGGLFSRMKNLALDAMLFRPIAHLVELGYKRSIGGGSSQVISNQQRSDAGSHPEAPSSLVPAKLVSLLTGSSKKRALSVDSLSSVPNHSPVFMRQKVASDRQSGALSSLLSNPLGLGLLFSAPLLPSLLLTPLAIAGLSPAMSAINNFFGDDEDEKPTAASSGPLAALFGAGAGQQSGGGIGGGSSSAANSALASILQASGVPPPASSADGVAANSPASSLALRTFQTFIGPTSTTERPLFNPGIFGSSSVSNGIQNSFANLANSANINNQPPQRASGFLGAGSGSGSAGSQLFQAAASMIAPSFVPPPSQAGGQSAAAAPTSDDDNGPGLMQMASGVFEKVAGYVGSTQTGIESNKDIGQASGQTSSPANSPLSTLSALASLSPFQLSKLFASTPIGSAAISPSGNSGAAAGPSSPQKPGFFSTLRNVYELFSSSFLRRQADGSDTNECQQRLICELHQRAMNSKLFKRSLQTNLMELANLDKNLLEQIKYSAGVSGLQARVDADTKAMLNDFLKATSNFKNGREMIDCGQMFPKCSRVQLLAAANAHLTDPVNGRTIGKFSQLIKKMKFKANQQHQSQWKLRKSTGNNNKAVPMVQQQIPMVQQQIPMVQQQVPMVQQQVQMGPQQVQMSPQQVQMSPQQVQMGPQQVQMSSQQMQMNPQQVQMNPQQVQMNPQQVQMSPQHVQMSPQQVQMSPQQVQMGPQQVQMSSQQAPMGQMMA